MMMMIMVEVMANMKTNMHVMVMMITIGEPNPMHDIK